MAELLVACTVIVACVAVLGCAAAYSSDIRRESEESAP